MIIMDFLDPIERRIKKQMQGMDTFSRICGIILFFLESLLCIVVCIV